MMVIISYLVRKKLVKDARLEHYYPQRLVIKQKKHIEVKGDNGEIKTVEDYVKEIEIQAKKPISEQINDLKVAGATFLVKLDEYIRHLNQSNN